MREGRVNDSETIEIEIPAGVEGGMQLSMRGKGNAGKSGGPNGDLLINIEEKVHPHFSRDGKNIVYAIGAGAIGYFIFLMMKASKAEAYKMGTILIIFLLTTAFFVYYGQMMTSMNMVTINTMRGDLFGFSPGLTSRRVPLQDDPDKEGDYSSNRNNKDSKKKNKLD